MTSPQNAFDTLSRDLAEAWIASYKDDPMSPTDSENFERVQDLLDASIGEDPRAAIDGILDGTFQIVEDEEGKGVAVEFFQAIFSHFESVTESEEDHARTAAFVGLPVIGFKEHAERLAKEAPRLDFTKDLINSGALPPGSTVKWIERAFSLADIALWGADARRNILLSALEGKSPDTHVPPLAEKSFDPAELSMVVGVAIAPDEAFEGSLQNPAFLYASPDEEFHAEDEKSFHDWSLEKRMEAHEAASTAMTEKLEAVGIDAVIIDHPGVLPECMATLVSWSLRAQFIHEMSITGWSHAQIHDAAEDAAVRVAIDVEEEKISMSVESRGATWGPYQTDWPWKHLPMELISEYLRRREVLKSHDQIEWHLNEASMWQSTQASPQRKWRLQ